jgi:hypothetical protein
VSVQFRLIMGSTTTFGTGTYTFSLPVTAVDIVAVGPAVLFDSNNTPTQQAGSVNFASTTTVQIWPGTAGGGRVGATTPFTWQVSDQILWSFTYEAA